MTAAQEAFGEVAAVVGDALRQDHETVEDMWAAMAEAGAGSAWELVQARALELEPAPRFVDEHDWWLELLDRRVELDRRLGEALESADGVSVLADDIRLAITADPYPELDPAFGAAFAPDTALGERLDPSEAIGRDPYAIALFAALRSQAFDDEAVAAVDSLEFPGVTPADQLGALARVGDELIADFATSASTVGALTPPASSAEDHVLVVGYFERQAQNLGDLVAAATEGDREAVSAAIASGVGAYCSMRDALSDAIAPVTDIYFEARSRIC